MVVKQCIICDAEFKVWGKAKTCSTECGKANFNRTRREWRRQPKVKATEREYARNYHQRPEVKDADHERDRKRREKPERKQYERERKALPRNKEYMREYDRRPKRNEYKRNYLRDYGRRPEVKEVARERRERPDVKEQKRAYDRSPEARKSKRARSRKYYARTKSETLIFAREMLTGKYPDLISTEHEPCLLYTAICRETGQVLYIGITDDWERRQKQHAISHKGAQWLPAAEITIDVYPSRTLAMAAEMVAIKEHRPPFNERHNGTTQPNVDNLHKPRYKAACPQLGLKRR